MQLKTRRIKVPMKYVGNQLKYFIIFPDHMAFVVSVCFLTFVISGVFFPK